MKNTTKRLFSLVLTVVMMMDFALTSFAAGIVEYTLDDSNPFMFAPGSEYSKTDLFTVFKNMMPGDETDPVDVAFVYNGKSGVSCNVYLKAVMPTTNKVKEGDGDDTDGYTNKTINNDLLEYVSLNVKDEKGNVIFDGKLGGEDKSTDLDGFVKIASLRKGKETRLSVVAKLDITASNDVADSAAAIDWVFKIEEIPDPVPPPVVPDTGDNTGAMMYAAMFGVAAMALIVIIILKKRKTEE